MGPLLQTKNDHCAQQRFRSIRKSTKADYRYLLCTQYVAKGTYSKTCLKRSRKEDQKEGFQDQ